MNGAVRSFYWENLILPEHEAQIINYLKASHVQLGLLINFGEKNLTYKRYINIY